MVRVVKIRRKKKYTSCLEPVQRIEAGCARASAQMAKAVAAGFSEYSRLNDRSARRNRDGAILDVFENVFRGLGKTLSKSAEIPGQLVGGLDTESVYRELRRIPAPPPFNFFFS